MDNGINNMEHDKSLLIYYVVLAVVAILVSVWYFFVYPNRNLPVKPPVKSGQDLVKVRDDLVGSYNDSANKLSPTQLKTVQKSLQKSASSQSNKLTNTQLEDTANSLKNASKSSEF